MLYGTITEFCTESSCSVMSAGPKYEVNFKLDIHCNTVEFLFQKFLKVHIFMYRVKILSFGLSLLKYLM